MARILIRKRQKAFVQELNREVVVGKAARHYVSDLSRPFSTMSGVIPVSELAKPDGSEVLTDSKKAFTIISPNFADEFRRIKRLPQAIPLKDIGLVMAECGVGPETIAVDSGTGSGAMAMMLARVCKKVYTFDIEDEHLAVAEENKQKLGLVNMEIKKGDFTKGVDAKDADLVTLDLPAPWEAIDSARACLKVGGFLVSYSPSMAQSMEMGNTLSSREDFLVLKTVELMEREWEIDGRKVRPKNKTMIHSGFLTFARRIR